MDEDNTINKIIHTYIRFKSGTKIYEIQVNHAVQYPVKRFDISLECSDLPLDAYIVIFSMFKDYSILNLSRNRFDKKETSELARIFSFIPPSIQILHLSLIDIENRTDKELLILAKALPNIRSIELRTEGTHKLLEHSAGKKLEQFIKLWHKEQTHEIYPKLEDTGIPSDVNLLIQEYMMDELSINIPQFKDIKEFIKTHEAITKASKAPNPPEIVQTPKIAQPPNVIAQPPNVPKVESSSFKLNYLYALAGISSVAMIAGIISCFLLPIVAGAALIGLGVVGGAIAFGLFKHGSAKQTANAIEEDSVPAPTH